MHQAASSQGGFHLAFALMVFAPEATAGPPSNCSGSGGSQRYQSVTPEVAARVSPAFRPKCLAIRRKGGCKTKCVFVCVCVRGCAVARFWDVCMEGQARGSEKRVRSPKRGGFGLTELGVRRESVPRALCDATHPDCVGMGGCFQCSSKSELCEAASSLGSHLVLTCPNPLGRPHEDPLQSWPPTCAQGTLVDQSDVEQPVPRLGSARSGSACPACGWYKAALDPHARTRAHGRAHRAQT